MDENFGSHLEDRIDSAVDNPTAYNFSVDENSKIYDRKVPFYSNVDKKYEASQEEMARKLSNLDVEATEGDKSEDQPRKIRTKLTDFDPEK